MVEWIEMDDTNKVLSILMSVSTLVVEWIEIFKDMCYRMEVKVSTLVVEWIEIDWVSRNQTLVESLHPRGGVD